MTERSGFDQVRAQLDAEALEWELPPPEAYEGEARSNGHDTAPAPKRLRPKPIEWSSLRGKAPPARTWWIQDWLSPAPTLCAGAGGVGKSLLWQTIGTALATGKEFLGATTPPLKVVMWSCEDDQDEIWRRQLPICEHFGIGLDDLSSLTMVPRHGADNTLFELEFGKPTFTSNHLLLREQVNDLKADVLVLDNIGQVYGGQESDRHQVTKFVNGIHGLVIGRPFASVFIGHVARAQGSEFSGSAAWENACRMRWYMGTSLPDQKPDDDEQPVDTGVIYLAKRKANYSEKDYRRLKFDKGLLVPEEFEGRRFDQSHQNDIAERVVLSAMPKLIAVGVLPTDGKTSGDYLPVQILAKGFAQGHQKKELTAAMNRLMGAGKLKRAEVGKYSNRSARFGLVVVP
jgi:hypothetical protein